MQPRLRLPSLLAAAFLLLAAGPLPAEGEGEDLTRLLDGVRAIDSPGVPGALSCLGSRAFPIVCGARERQQAPVVAAARAGQGRLVAFAHGGYLAGPADGRRDTRRLVRNAVAWAAGDAPPTPVRVAAVGRTRPFVAGVALADDDWRVVRLDPSDLERRVPDADVLVLDGGGTLSQAAIARLRARVEAGGGLVVAATGWGWQQLHPQEDLARDYWANRLLGPLGLVFTNVTVTDTAPDGFAVAPVDPAPHQALPLLRVLLSPAGLSGLGAAARAQAASTLLLATQAADPERDGLAADLARLRAAASGGRVPSAEHPLTAADLVPRLALLLELDERSGAPAEARGAHPAAAIFPGAVPEGTEVASLDVTVDRAVPGWHSTGRYAPPGGVVTVRAVDDAAPIEGLRLRIGCHTDDLRAKDRWARAPRITRSDPIPPEGLSTSNPFGGLVYVEVPDDAGTGRATLRIDGAVPAPLYVEGETDPEAWRREIRARPAPWGEVQARSVVVTVPSPLLRALDDPGRLVATWNAVLDACAELAGRRIERRRPERIVADVQISAGYMHAGYPIMTHLDAAEAMADAEALRRGNWGLFHELGHNHQHPDWTFDGTVEVTCNLFTLYVYEKVCGIGLDSERLHPAIRPAARDQRRRAFAGPSADFGAWKRDPFLALTTYVELIDAFGWDAIRDVIAAYHDLPREARPHTDAEKRDQWVVRLSERVGHDLAPYFRSWSVPVSEAAEARTRSLPRWPG